MNTSRKTVLSISGILLGLSLVVGQAQAAPIVGDISFGMSAVAVNAGGVALTSFTGATGIDFAEGSPNAFVTGASGDYATAGFGFPDEATFSDFSFIGNNNPFPGVPPTLELWTADSGVGSMASFDLESLTVDVQTANTLNLSGSGTLFLTGSMPTQGIWTLSGDISTGSASFGFSSTNTAIPEPSMLALLGLGLLGFAGSRRLNKKI